MYRFPCPHTTNNKKRKKPRVYLPPKSSVTIKSGTVLVLYRIQLLYTRSTFTHTDL